MGSCDGGTAIRSSTMSSSRSPSWITPGPTTACPAGPSRPGAPRGPMTTWPTTHSRTRRCPTGSSRELGIRAVIAAPLLGEDGPMGAIGVFAETPGAFDADAGELLGLLADQAAIVLTNARLNAEAEVTAEELAHQVEAQRTLGEIAASITSLRDPSAVLSRAVAETKRLLGAEHVVIHQVRAGTSELADYREVFGAGADAAPVDETIVSIGQGIAGRAVAEGTVAWTGDYLGDASFAHTSRADEWIGRYGYRSQMSAPLIGESGPLGAISAYSSRSDAFDERRRRAAWRAGQPGRDRARQREAVRGARAPGRGTALARRDRGSHHGHPRPRRRAAADARRGGAAARCRRRADRAGGFQRRPALGVRTLGHRPADRARRGGRPGRAQRGRLRTCRDRAPRRSHRRLPGRPASSPTPRRRTGTSASTESDR